MPKGPTNQLARPISQDKARKLDDELTATTTVKPVVILDTLNVEQIKLINAFYATGLWGNSPKQVVINLLNYALRTLHEKPGG